MSTLAPDPASVLFGAPTGSMAGKSKVTLVPCPGVESTLICPPCSFTTAATTASPSPVPRPRGLVVENGSKIRSRTSSVMPMPVSDHAQAYCSEVPSRSPPSGIRSTAITKLPPRSASRHARSEPDSPALAVAGPDSPKPIRPPRGQRNRRESGLMHGMVSLSNRIVSATSLPISTGSISVPACPLKVRSDRVRSVP